VFDLRAKQDLNKGYGTATSRGVEFALTPMVMAGFGWLIDRWVGTPFVFTIAFLVLGVVGMFVKVWLGYDAEMKRHDEGKAWERRPEQGSE
jgi:F0F1-type ATP synthase assembly protein I